MLSTFLDQLAKEWELEEGFPQEMPGVYSIPLEEGVVVSLTDQPQGGIYLSSTVAPVPQAKEVFFGKALRANLFGRATRQSVLGLNESGTLLTLSREITNDVNFKEFKEILEDFMNTLDTWREEAALS